jgi:Zn-dependent protease
MEEFSILQRIALLVVPLVLAVTVHEAAHGWVADKFGDSTARAQGRITFNPLPHIDPVGTILVPMLMLLFTGFMFGWAKPVPVNFSRLHNPKRDMIWVALAGPGANLLMAIVWSLVLVVSHNLVTVWPWAAVPLLSMAVGGVFINLVLMALNLIPVPPLDGGRVAVGLLPMRAARAYAGLEPYGMVIVILLLVLGVVGTVIGPVVFGLVDLLPGSQLVHVILPALL